jgi:Fe2+ transport system protein FeoA
MTKVAPMGDPIELLVRGCRLSIRRQEADLLMVSATGAVRT